MGIKIIMAPALLTGKRCANTECEDIGGTQRLSAIVAGGGFIPIRVVITGLLFRRRGLIRCPPP